MKRRLVPLALCALLSLVGGCSKKKPVPSKGSESSSEDQPDKTAKGGAQASDVVKMEAEDQRKAGIQVDYVLLQPMPRVLSVAGQVVLDEQHTSHLGTIADGRITAVTVLPGAPVRRGQVLGELHSHMVHETVGALVQAYAEVDRQRGAVTFARQAQDRYHHLFAIQAASLVESQRANQEVLQAQKMLVDAEANVHMEREQFS